MAEIVPNLVEGGRAAVLKPGSLRESSKPFTTKENRREGNDITFWIPRSNQPVSPNDLTRLLSQNSQLMLPLVELVEQCRGAVDEVIDVTGRAAIQAVLELSAQQVTGGKLSQPGKKRRGDVVRWGRQPGRVKLSNRKLRVSKPRLRKRSRRRGQSAPLTKRCRTTNASVRACSTF